MEKRIDLTGALKYGFNTVIDNPGLFILATLVFAGLSCLSIVTIIFMPFVMAGLYAGYVKLALDFNKTGTAQIETIYSTFRFMLRMLGASLLYGLITTIGYLLCVIPGVVWSMQFVFYPFFIVEENCGVIEAFRRSSRIMYGAKWSYLPLYIIIGVLRYLFNLTIIGIFFIMPVLLLANIFVYRQLLAQESKK